jgi:hypothetical protein
VFGNLDVDIVTQASEEDHGRFLALLAAVLFGPNRIRRRETEVGIELQLFGADAGFLLELAQSALALGLPLLEMALGKVKTRGVDHQQEGIDR